MVLTREVVWRSMALTREVLKDTQMALTREVISQRGHSTHGNGRERLNWFCCTVRLILFYFASLRIQWNGVSPRRQSEDWL